MVFAASWSGVCSSAVIDRNTLCTWSFFFCFIAYIDVNKTFSALYFFACVSITWINVSYHHSPFFTTRQYLYTNQISSFPMQPALGRSCSTLARNSAFFLFSFTRYAKLIPANTAAKALITTNTFVPSTYLGAGDKEPKSQVERIPPAFVRVKASAMAVARRT